MFWKLLTGQLLVAAIAVAAALAAASPRAALDRSAARFAVFSGLAVGGAAALAVAAFVARRWGRRLAEAEKVLVDLPWEGSDAPPAGLDARDEFGRLARALDQARRRLREQFRGVDRVRQDLQSMLETIPEAVIALDADQRVLFANQSTFRLFEVAEGDVVGRKLWEAIRQPGLQDSVTKTFASGRPTNTEFEMRQPARIVSFRGRTLSVGSGRGVILVLNDVTELRRLERMRQDFFASVSHELKTPLAAIKAYGETLLDDDGRDPTVLRRFLERIAEQADRLHSLVLDMLMLARVESEDHGFEFQPIHASRIVAASVEAFRSEADAKRVALELVARAQEDMVLADVEGLGMIVRNLVDNAVKYTPPGGRVCVRVEAANDAVLIVVEDTGVGIPPEDLSRIFERFYRVDKARSRELGGTGLGLSIVKHTVQRFGGSIAVRSRLNEGSEFQVSLPIWRPREIGPRRRQRMAQESSA
jgi:two-component system phosphate regulon sensor histidine kinase PhoR